MTRGDVAFLCFSHGANDRGETSQSHSCVLCHPVVLLSFISYISAFLHTQRILYNVKV